MKKPGIVPWFFCLFTTHLFPYERGNPLEKRGGIVKNDVVENRYLCE